MRHVRVVLALAAVVFTLEAWADDARPDFYLLFSECKSLGVAGRPSEPRLVEAQAYALGCWKREQQASCIFRGDGEEKEVVYTVDLDIPPLMILVQGQNAADFVSVDTSRRSTSSITRTFLPDGGIVAKVCSGVYATPAQVEAMRAAEAAAKESPAPQRAAPPAAAPVYTPEPAAEPSRSCCKVCTKGCPCGDSCISCSKTCRKGPGCAC